MSSYPPYPYDTAQVPRMPTIDRSDRHRVWQLVLGVVSYLIATLVGGVIGVFLHFFRTGNVDFMAVDGIDMLVAMIFAAATSLLLYILIMRTVAGTPGLGLRGSAVAMEFLIGLAVGTVLIAVSVGIIALFGGYRISGVHLSSGILTGLAMGIGAGFTEEILFRGFLLRILDAWTGTWWALIITSVIFGALHLINPESTVFGAISITVSAGALLGGAYILTRRLWLPIAIHIAWNFVQGGIFSSDVSGTGNLSGLFIAHWQGPTLLTGGPMGMEGSVITLIVAVLAAGGILHLAIKQGMITKPARRSASAEGTPLH